MSTPYQPRRLRFILWFEGLVPGICFVLFIVLACITGVYWRRVHNHHILYQPPYSPDIQPGTLTPFIITLIGVAFFLIAIFTPHSKKWWIINIIIRLGLSMGLVASAVLQSHYLVPLPLGSCKNQDVWRDSSVPEDVPTMFEVLPVRHGRNKFGKSTTSRPCNALLIIWRFEIAVAVLTAILALCACYLAMGTIEDDLPRYSRAAVALRWIGRPFSAVKDHVGRAWGKAKRRRERKDEEAKILANDPGSLVYNDHEMGIRVRPM